MGKKEVVFVDGVRTAFGKIGGSLKDYTAEELAGIGLKGLVEKTKICERSRVDNVYMGMAFHPACAINPSRWALLYAGLPESTSASAVELQCGSAIDSINHAAWKILAGMADIVIAGGMESFSQLPRKYSTSVEPYRLNTIKLLDFQLQPPSKEKTTYLPFDMGLTAENLADLYKISREEQDEFAFRSQALARKAIEAGYFADEIISVPVPQGKKKPPLDFKVDEFPRLTPMDGLAALPPAFKKGGSVTAGNSSGLNDGSAFVLMMTREKALELGYEPQARWVGSAEWGVDPGIMGVAPAYALPIAMKRAGIEKLSDFDVVECNEAFAAQNLAVIRELEKQTGQKVIMDNWNPNGGAIAYGHANGASGARIAMLCMKELIRRGGRFGTFGACCGGGQGVVTIIENLKR
ncbi:MAG: acetyl-CoA C-acyltransferase [Deltaproteobacteria bacterium HGW-Deltaproteobacteria-6]|jgi:acetyl-CoA C-acetyltransferase|nr:MAG: acetyl-CoA C-acyltransferase [Deltaproteobacteria bacterium HGW-Deltaproteobacteria-6]